MTESDIIRHLAGKFPRSSRQANDLFECDAELVKIGAQIWGMTMDEFSPGEDRFTSENPAQLGANLAVATLSDLLAADIEPRFYMHALSLPKDAPRSFLDGLTDGIRDILEQAGCFLIGGDTGMADSWLYCGFAMGPAAAANPRTRIFGAESKTLWITGALGDANLAAFSGAPTPLFEFRLEESRCVRRCASAGMDTSSGLMDALWTLHTLNPAWRIDFEIERVPLAAGLREAARALKLPPEAALVGAAGEYELVFASDLPGDQPAPHPCLTPIARLSRAGPPHGVPGLFIQRDGQPPVSVDHPPPCPRAAPSLSGYIAEIITYANLLQTP